MTKILNEGDVIELAQHEGHNDACCMLLAKELKLESHKNIQFHTQVYVECEKSYEQCFAKERLDFDEYGVFVQSQRYTMRDGQQEIILVLYNTKEEEITLPKGTDISHIYDTVINDGSVDIDVDAINIYKDEHIVAKSLDKETRSVIITTDEKGEKYLSIKMDY